MGFLSELGIFKTAKAVISRNQIKRMVYLSVTKKRKRLEKMTVNIYDSANQIEREIRDLPEFTDLQAAFAAVKENTESFELFRGFQGLQQNLQQKQMAGEEFSEEDAQQAQEFAVKVQADELINDLMLKEQTFSVIINDLNQIIMKPIQELYQEQ